MICFKDRTFCSHDVEGCPRRFTPELQAEADRWWGKPGAPVAFANFCDGACTLRTITAPDLPTYTPGLFTHVERSDA